MPVAAIEERLDGNDRKTAKEWFIKGCRYDRLMSDPDKAAEAYKICVRLDG